MALAFVFKHFQKCPLTKYCSHWTTASIVKPTTHSKPSRAVKYVRRYPSEDFVSFSALTITEFVIIRRVRRRERRLFAATKQTHEQSVYAAGVQRNKRNLCTAHCRCVVRARSNIYNYVSRSERRNVIDDQSCESFQ